ncbi:PQ-loop-domain-containing protein [Tuber magnatum]|uniref:PQ-loop-domain-containing protein n=1 Tax=Tuber magnatum TaxID=42249 RepID=A0A317SVU9_9PEZI|nr:PQ-loop-domain-containing protein [Tuber magnatum]
MFPPAQQLDIDARAISGITGSISIACWIVVFSPQIIANFRRGSAEGLSLAFLIVWLVGDVFNVLGAVLQGVLPTMVMLAVYYTLADIVLLFQCLYYNRVNSHNASLLPVSNGSATVVDGSHLSPATPLLDPAKEPIQAEPQGLTKSIFFNAFSILMVCLAGALGWWASNRYSDSDPPVKGDGDDLSFSVLGQAFGYFCAVLYLASRVPQILLNYRRQSCEGISLLFFLFACIGNMTYVVSILAYVPHSEDGPGQEYRRYIAVNASWLLGSVGTLFLDLIIFAQFFWYKSTEEEYESSSEDDG